MNDIKFQLDSSNYEDGKNHLKIGDVILYPNPYMSVNTELESEFTILYNNGNNYISRILSKKRFVRIIQFWFWTYWYKLWLNH